MSESVRYCLHGKQLILSFKHPSFIEIPRTGDNSLLFLEITVEKNKSASGREYHKRIVGSSADKELIEKIINHKVETPVRIGERLNSNEFIYINNHNFKVLFFYHYASNTILLRTQVLLRKWVLIHLM